MTHTPTEAEVEAAALARYVLDPWRDGEVYPGRSGPTLAPIPWESLPKLAQDNMLDWMRAALTAAYAVREKIEAQEAVPVQAALQSSSGPQDVLSSSGPTVEGER